MENAETYFFNHLAEEQLLGGMLLEESSVIDRIRPEIFHSKQNQKDFLRIREIIDSNDGKIELSEAASAIGIDRATALMDVAHSRGSEERILSILDRCYENRRLYETADSVCKKLKQGVPADELQDQLEHYLSCNTDTGRRSGKKLSDLLPIAFNNLGKIDEIGIKSGFESLDKVLLGFMPGSLTVIAARTSEGKSSLLHCIMNNIGFSGKKMVLFSLEDPAESVTEKMLLKDAEVSHSQIWENPDDSMIRIMQSMDKFMTMKSIIYDSPNLTIDAMRRDLKQIERREGKTDIVFLDYLQLMKGNTKDRNKVYELDELAQGLKNLAMELMIPVVTAAQLNREAEGKMPTLANLRGSGGIEQAADNVLLIDRSEEEVTGRVGIIIAKHRAGTRAPNTPIPVNWIPAFAKFTDAGGGS